MNKASKKENYYLIDGSGYIFRAYYALPPLSRKSDGLPTGAVAGFCNMLFKLLEDVKSNRMDASTVALIAVSVLFALTLIGGGYYNCWRRQKQKTMIAEVNQMNEGQTEQVDDEQAKKNQELAKQLAKLTPQQYNVLALVADGQLNKQIAGILDIKENTVKKHVSAILLQLGVHNRTLAGLAYQQLMLNPPQHDVI